MNLFNKNIRILRKNIKHYRKVIHRHNINSDLWSYAKLGIEVEIDRFRKGKL